MLLNTGEATVCMLHATNHQRAASLRFGEKEKKVKKEKGGTAD